MDDYAYSFRTAFNGFHRGDVIDYLEILSSEHSVELKKKEQELRLVKEELSALKKKKQEPCGIGDESAALQQKEQELCSAREEIASLKQQLAQYEAQPKAEQIVPAPVSEPVSDTSLVSQELEAYRRAERVEREAQARADRLYSNACDAVLQAQSSLNQQDSKFELLETNLSELLSNARTTIDEICAALNDTHERIQKLQQDLD